MTRFSITIRGYEPREEDGWTHQLNLLDRAHLDSDGFPVHAVMAGNSWTEAFEQAFASISEALAVDYSLFS